MLVTERDCFALCNLWHIEPVRPKRSAHFHSALFARHDATPLPIEIMASLRIASLNWALLRPQTRVAVPAGRGTVFIPAAAEQVTILRSFGRDKDLQRAHRLQLGTGERST